MHSLVTTWPGMTIIDVGCGTDGRSYSNFADPEWKITGIDIHESGMVAHSHPNFVYQRCSAIDLSRFGDKSFDLAVSVGMIEHIVDKNDYERASAEIQRVATQYIVVAPYKWAWIEPHYAFPFFGALPQSIQIGLIRMFNLSGHRNRIDYFLKNFTWRSNSQYRNDFKGSEVRILPVLDTIAIVKSA
jgi:ubiquinone/menaquinone biosynthesis C-methylase UbiE